jgi:hypothetical protein
MASDDADSPAAESRCYYHPRRPALVRCGNCGKALCSECIHHGPVGVRCVECLYGIKAEPVSSARGLAAGLTALLAAAVIGAALGWSGWLNLLTAIALGLVVGHATKVLARRAPAPSMQAAAGIAAMVGAYSGAVAAKTRLLAQAGAPAFSVARAAAQVGLGEWVVAGLIAAGIAIYWVWRG